MPDPLVGRDLDLALDVLGHVSAEVALHLVVAVDPVPDPDDLLLGQVADLPPAVQPQSLDRLASCGRPDAVDVPKGDVDPLLAREVDACDASHTLPPSPAVACGGG